MKTVRLDFESEAATRRAWFLGRGHSALPVLGAAILLAAVAYLVALGAQWVATRQELAGVQAELQARGRLKPAPTESRASLSAQERRAWNQVTGQLNTPWASVLSALEQATPDDVALVSIEPDARQQSVRLQAEAKTLDTLLAYAQGLAAVPPFSEAVPLKHETNEQDPNRPIRLSLSLRLRSAPVARMPEGEAP